MFPGTPNIKICLDCDGLIKEGVLLSGNTFGADFYTDGKMEAPMLPEQHALFKCPHCQSLMWSDDLQIIDSDELDEQVNVTPYLVPNFDEYLYKLKDGDIDKEEYLRVKAWHAGNDQRRKNNTKQELSIDEVDNLKKLGDILGLSDDELIYKAEIKRELSLFSESIDLLKDFNDFSMDVVHTIRRLTLERIPFVSLTDEYCKEFYDDGVKKNKGYKVNDKKYGLWVEYYSNGNKERENNYRDGEKFGIQTIWHENGNKSLEWEILDDGKEISSNWYKNGQKEYEYTTVNGDREGVYISWHENGQKQEEGVFLEGVKFGIWITWYQNGQKESESEFINLRKCDEYKITKYFESGGVESITGNWIDDGNLAGLCTWFYENGQKEAEGEFIPGQIFDRNREYDDYDFAAWQPSVRDGLWSYWYETGQKKSQCFYSDNVIDGLYIGYYKNGQKKVEKIYKAVEDKDHDMGYETPKKILSLKDGVVAIYKNNGTKKLELNYKYIFELFPGYTKHKSMRDGVCTKWLEDGSKVTTRYMAYYANYCIDPPRRRHGATCDIFIRNE